MRFKVKKRLDSYTNYSIMAIWKTKNYLKSLMKQ